MNRNDNSGLQQKEFIFIGSFKDLVIWSSFSSSSNTIIQVASNFHPLFIYFDDSCFSIYSSLQSITLTSYPRSLYFICISGYHILFTLNNFNSLPNLNLFPFLMSFCSISPLSLASISSPLSSIGDYSFFE
jgi:hypothetical protein